MRPDPRWMQLLPSPVRRLPADLAGCVLLVLLTLLAVFLPWVSETPLRIALGLPFVLFVPGYALVAALFPEAGEPSVEDSDGDRTRMGDADPETEGDGVDANTAAEREGIDGIERVALSFGTSIAVVPLVGLVLNFTPFGIRLVPIMLSLSGLTLALVAVAAHRRRALPPEERFAVPYGEWLAAGRSELLEPGTRGDAALNVLLVASVLLAVGSVGYAVAVPNEGERFTEFYLLTEDEDGELVADDYPTEFAAGESAPLVVGIGNQEHEPVDYTVVVLLQEVRIEDNETTVLAESRLDRFETRVTHNETWHLNHTVTPDRTGEDLRLTYLLYRGEPPADPTVENAYRELHVWVTVNETG